jgi:tetratricopeptide (TPR) repeat protein
MRTRTTAGLLCLLAFGCSVRSIAVRSLADALASSGDVFSSDEDPELVRDALPFALKTIETLLASEPEHEGLLLQACSGFTQYAYAFIETDADLVEEEDYREAERLRGRALRMYLRARDYGLRALEVRHPGISERLRVEPEDAVTKTGVEEVASLYWTGAAWGAAVSLGKDRPDLVADLPATIALMRRALALDEAYGEGAIHEVLISIESLPANMGGSLQRAREHFDRARELSKGKRASVYVSLARNVSVRIQDREEFVRLLGQALSVDPDSVPRSRLGNLVAQRRARHLLRIVDDLFLEGVGEDAS